VKDEVVVGGGKVVDGGELPDNDRTNVSLRNPEDVKPTATHSDTLRHDTDSSPSAKAALGLGTIDHTLPSHTITNASEAV
jgi:hypothetical protein